MEKANHDRPGIGWRIGVGRRARLPVRPGCGPSRVHDGRLQAADYWSDEPAILSAGLGFDNIIGLLELTRETVSAAGGSWYDGLTCASGEEPQASSLTSAATVETIERGYHIDIILVGDDAAARNIIAVEIPTVQGGKKAFYNPGGPGPKPFPGVRYSEPGPRDLEPVVIALDDPMRVSRDH